MSAHPGSVTIQGTETPVASAAIQEWLNQGETLYEASMADFRTLETQLAELETKLAEKRAEVNQIAQLIGKPPAEGTKRLTAQLIDERDRPIGVSGAPGSTTHIARALAGKFGR